MKNLIGEKRYEEVQHALYLYLKTTESFNDKTLFKAIQINCINADDENKPSDVYVRQSENLIDKLRKSGEKLSELACLLIFLNNEDYEQVAYTMHDKIDYSTIDDPELLEKLELIRRFIRLLYLHIDDSVIPTLENLMQILPQAIDSSLILWEFYHFNNDTDDRDYDLLIDMANTIIKYRPNEYSTYFVMGFLYVEQEDFSLGLIAYNKALELCQVYPNLYEQSWLYMRISDCLFNLKRHKEVIVNTDLALQYYGKYNVGIENDAEFYHFTYKLRCKSYFTLKEYQLSLENANKALDYCPQENREAMLGLRETIEKHC